MPRLPDLLRLLTRDELLAAADRLGVALPERRAKDPIVEALAAAPAATPEAVLADLKRDRLKALCRALDLDDSGKEKAEIIARLAGGPTTSEARGQAKLDFAGTTDPPASRRARPPKALEDAVEALTPAPVSGPHTSDAPRRGRPPKAASAPATSLTPDEVARQAHDAQLAGKLTREQLHRLVMHFAQIDLRNRSLSEPDMLGRAYEYLIEKFADDAGKKGGAFYTPNQVVRLLVELLEPAKGMRICDPTCGSGGMLVQSAQFVAERGGSAKNLSLYGQEKNLGTWAICKMNVLLHGIVDHRIEKGDTLRDPKLLEAAILGSRVRRALGARAVLAGAARRASADLVGGMCVFDGAPRDEMAEVTAGSLISDLLLLRGYPLAPESRPLDQIPNSKGLVRHASPVISKAQTPASARPEPRRFYGFSSTRHTRRERAGVAQRPRRQASALGQRPGAAAGAGGARRERADLRSFANGLVAPGTPALETSERLGHSPGVQTAHTVTAAAHGSSDDVALSAAKTVRET
jgi:hypothetical protein